MVTWFLALSLVAKLWVVYGVAAVLLLALALLWEYCASWEKVDGAAGWMLFAAISLAVSGAFVCGAISLLIWLVQWLWPH